MQMDLSVPGFSLYFPKGIDLQIGSIGAPFLSWSEGSVDQAVATPALPWILVSFRQGQPPVLFSFKDHPQATIIDGEPGQWHLRTVGSFSGWVRVLLPFGLDVRSAVTASSLGELAQKVTADQDLWSGAPPKLLNTKVETDATGITVTWVFDKAGALVPQAALLSGFGGYPLHVTTKISQLETSSEEGPMAITREPNLSIRFPLQAWPKCRYMAFQNGVREMPAAPLDVAGAVKWAFRSLASDFSSDENSVAGQALITFLSHAKGDVEQFTGVRYTYGASGVGYDVTAAHALLTQALSVSNGSPSLQNPLLTETWSRVDSYTWQPWNMDEAIWRRASALGALAFAMRPEAENRLQGAMLQAGLSAERGLDLWHYWRGDITKLPARLEVMENLRRRIFSLQGAAVPDSLVDELFGSIRSCNAQPVTITSAQLNLFLRWKSFDGSPGDLEFIAPKETTFPWKGNLSSMKVTQSGDHFVLHYVPKASGDCFVVVKLVGDGASIPTEDSEPYVEASH